MSVPGFHHKRITWASIFAGLLVALGIQLLLSLLGIGIGMGSVNPLRDRNPAAGMGIVAMLWWAISFLLAVFAGGWVAGRLSKTGNKFETNMHGILTWALFVIVNVYIMSSAAGSILYTAGNIAGRADSATIQERITAVNANPLQSEARVRLAANDVASALSKAGIFSFVGLLLGAVLAAVGSGFGRGTQNDDYDAFDDVRQRHDPGVPRAASPVVG